MASEGVQLARQEWTGEDGGQHLIPGAVYKRSFRWGWMERDKGVACRTTMGVHTQLSVAFFEVHFPENTIHVDKVSVKGAPRANEIALAAVNGPSECRTGTTAEFEVDVYNSAPRLPGSFTVAMASETTSSNADRRGHACRRKEER